MSVRKPVTITLPADEALELVPVLLACEKVYENPEASVDRSRAPIAAALLGGAARFIIDALSDQLTPDEIEEMTKPNSS